MRYAAIILLAGATLWSCSRSHTIEVANQSGIDREGELKLLLMQLAQRA